MSADACAGPLLTRRALQTGAAPWLPTANSFGDLVADARCALGPDAERREQQLGDPVGLLEMRVAGADHRIDADRLVLAQPLGHRSGVPTSAVPAPARTRPTPAQRFGATSSLSRRPPCSSAIRRWPTLVHLLDEALLRVLDLRVGDLADQPVRRRPGLVLGLADDEVQADAEADSLRPAWPRRRCACSIFSATAADGSPQVRYLSTCPAARSCPASDEPPKYSGGIGFCTGRIVEPAALDRLMCLPSKSTGSPDSSPRQTVRNSSACA